MWIVEGKSDRHNFSISYFSLTHAILFAIEMKLQGCQVSISIK